MTDEAARRASLFYAESYAGLYDQTIAMVVPNYHMLHESMRQLMRVQARRMPADTVILDVGSGTGAETKTMLEEAPKCRIVALDVCEPMHAVHRRALRADALERVEFVTADVMSLVAGPSGLLQLLPAGGPGFGAIISAFAIHHLEHDEKLEFFRAAYQALRPGGALILGDLFSAADAELAEALLEYDLEWIKGRFSAAASQGRLDVAMATEMAARWVHHYLVENRCEPLEDSVQALGQLRMLRESGFTAITVAYRFTLSGVVMAVKRAE